MAAGFAGLLFFQLLLDVIGISKLAGRDACSCSGSSARGAIPRQWHLHQRYEYRALIAPSLILRIASWLNWRWAFVLIGSLGLVWIVLWVTMTRNPAHESVWLTHGRLRVRRVVQAYSEVLRTAQFWRVFIVAVLVNPCLHFLLNWLPTYFSQESAVAPVGLKGILI